MKGNQKVNWNSPKIEKIYEKEIKNSPDNLSLAFKNIANRLGCSISNVTNRWYNNFRFKLVVFQTSSESIKKVNSKNTPVVRYNSKKKPIHQVVLSSQEFEGMKVFTVKQFFAI
jgi:hypothetical protein